MMATRIFHPRMRGAAAVELALLLPILLALTALVVDLGRLTYQYNVLHKAVREAGRYLSTKSPGSGTTDPWQNFGPSTTWNVAKYMVNQYKSSLSCPATGTCLTVVIRDSSTSGSPSLNNVLFSLPGETGSGSYNLVQVTVKDYRMSTLVVGPLLQLAGYGAILLPEVSATFEQK